MSSWGAKADTTTVKETAPVVPKIVYDRTYYSNLFNSQRAAHNEGRYALVGHENTCKTGLACYLLEPEILAGKKIYVFDVDNSAMSTIMDLYPDSENITVLPLLNEMDDSIFNEDNSVNYLQLIEKTKYFINVIAENIKNGEEVGGVIFDGGSTFLKWCEFSMRAALLRKGVIENEDDSFNQKEWRERNKLNRDVLDRLHALPVNKIFNTFHLKAVQQYMDDGSGKKVLMAVGERPDWEKGTMRRFSQQVFLSRYMKKADMAAGVKGDRTLSDGEWCVKATIEEMKGRFIQFVGQTHTILSVKDGRATWFGLPFLRSDLDDTTNTKE
mgnify:FL=1|tara:strand:+ start:4096 stop:5076 length:981 start_codon:yes stop_codon:yes gene_type:complete